MCGRYSIVINPAKILSQFGVAIELPKEGIPENYNVAPTQNGLVLTDKQPDQFSLFRWGLVPHWAKDIKIGSRMINARSENIEGKPSFRNPIRKQRCLVIGDSFYEWKRDGKNKQPMRILPEDDSLLIMAGIWSSWRDPNVENAETINTYSIITTNPNEEMQNIHDRMPVIFSLASQQKAWLNNELPLPEVLALLQPPPPATLKFYPVDTAVGNVRNNGPELHQPIS